MQPARPLRDVFDEVARGGLGADPADTLADSGHGDLPDQLVSEAIVSYTDTAPIEVAAHLAPFVKLHSAVPVDDAGDAEDLPAGSGLDLLATAPDPITPDPSAPDPTASDPTGPELEAGGGHLSEPASDPAEYADALDFGFGSGAAGDRAVEAAEPSIEDIDGAPAELGPADDLAPPESAAEPTAYPWIAPPEDEGGEEFEDGDAVG